MAPWPPTPTAPNQLACLHVPPPTRCPWAQPPVATTRRHCPACRYDKIRDFQEANPGKGLPVLAAEEAALMRSGIAELARLRRMGNKHVKHKPLEREVN